MTPSAHILMIDPAHFEVHYAINPWMRPGQWASDAATLRSRAQDSFMALRQTLEQIGCRVSTADGVAGLPDMVFPANAGIVLDRRVLLARFRHVERRGEEAHFAAIFRALRAKGVVDSVDVLPAGCYQEGAGDCIWDAARGHFWAGWGPRSSREAIDMIATHFGQRAVPLELVTERSYHLDVCFCPLSGGEILYYPPALSPEARARVAAEVPAEQRIEATDEDLAQFNVNAVNVGRDVVMSRCSARLHDLLEARGYRVRTVDLAPFMLSGGGAFCMTLRLDRSARVHASGVEPSLIG